MKTWLWVVLVMTLSSVSASAAPDVRHFYDAIDHFEVKVTFGSDLNDSVAMPTGGMCSVSAVIATGTVQLWAVSTSETAAASGTQIGGNFTASTTTGPRTFSPGLPFLKAVATVDATGSSLTIRCTNTQVSGGGGVNVDADGNGLYETAYLFDADQDGSTYVTCTAKDTPDSACKVSGEIIYRDFVDDVTCMVHGCGSIPKQMEQAGTINLRKGVYLNFPCWFPGSTNDPGDHLTRDSTTGDAAAYAGCVDGEDGLKVLSLTLAGWGGLIVGQGLAGEPTDTQALIDRGFGRTDATYIVDDRGNFSDAYFIGGSAAGHKTMAVGYALQASSVSEYGRGGFTGTGMGWGEIGQQTGDGADIRDNDTASICVCNADTCLRSDEEATTGAIAFTPLSITRGTKLLIVQDVDSTTSKEATTVASARDIGSTFVRGDCLAADHVEIPIGLETAGMDTNTPAEVSTGSFPVILREILEGAGKVYVLRDNYFASAAGFRDLTFEPNDWSNESGGDCSAVGLFNNGSDSTDDDCDTSFMATIHGYNQKVGFKNVSFRYWHHFALDGEATLTQTVPVVSEVLFQYGLGAPASDPGHGWRMEKVTIRDTVSRGDLIATFANALVMDDLLIQNSTFINVTSFNSQSNHRWNKIRIEGGEYQSAFSYGCGAKQMYLNDLFATGRSSFGPIAAVFKGLVYLACDDETDPISGIFISKISETAPGAHVYVTNYANGMGGSSVLVAVRIDPATEYDNIKNVFITDSGLFNDRSSLFAGTHTSRGTSCLVGIEDRGTAGLGALDGAGTALGELDTLRGFHLSDNYVKGQIFCEFGSGGYWDDVDSSCTDVNANPPGSGPQMTGGSDGYCDTDGTTAVTHNASLSALFDAHRTAARSRNIEDPF